jgi:2-iminobutanoate/2-iminopropanoate deaminase
MNFIFAKIRIFLNGSKPKSACLEIKRGAIRGLGVDLIGRFGKDYSMGHKGWTSPLAGPAIGPYRQATEAGGFVFLSGQLALDEAGNLIQGGVAEQTRKALERAQSLLKEGGLSLADVVKATVFLLDLKTFPEMNAVYAEFFPKDAPSRSTFQVAGLPKGGAVEIEFVARRPGS